MKHLFAFSLALVYLFTLGATAWGATITTTGSGNWSSTTVDAPWPGGTLPLSGDDVVVADGTTLILDQDATIASLTVGQGASATFQTSSAVATNLTINGNLLVNTAAIFKTLTAVLPASQLAHALTITGNITHNGATFDCRNGTSGTTLAVMNITFAGSTNCTVTINGTYSSTNGDFNAVTFNKTGGAKVILGSDMFINGGSSTGLATLNSIVTFTSGILETGSFTFVAQTSTGANVTGASSASYVVGAMGRGMSNSVGSSKDFPVGDANGYRPLNLRSTTAGTSTGHFATVRMLSGDANTGGSTLSGGIDKVSAVRYYKITYFSGASGAASMSFDRFSPSYGTDDGVLDGNTDLRVAYSTDSRTTWTGITQTTPHTTSLATPPTIITPDAVSPVVTLSSGGVSTMFVSLANIAGGVNPLPIQLASFTGTVLAVGTVRLDWMTISEVNNYGFYVQRRRIGAMSWEEIQNSFIAGHGTTNVPQHYTFTDNAVAPGTLQYRLKQIDLDGSTYHSEPIQVDVLTGVREVAPIEFALKQNYPNPFNPSTEIKFSVHASGHAVLDVYNAIGQKVATLFDDQVEAGRYYTMRFNGADLSSGVYFYRLTSGKQSDLKKLVLMK